MMDLIQYLQKKWRVWRVRMRYYSTPLKLRYSVRVLSQICDHPYLKLLGLLFTFSRHFPCILPPSPRQIISFAPETYMDEQHPQIYELRLIPAWRWRDTMQRSFYRLYEAFCAFDEVLIGYETEYIWKRQQNWNPELLRDPRHDGCTDPEQLAVLASLAETLVWSFNWRLSLGLRRDGRHVDRDGPEPTKYVPIGTPTWTNQAPVLDEKLILHKYDGPDDTTSDSDFEKRNIQATTAALRTV